MSRVDFQAALAATAGAVNAELDRLLPNIPGPENRVVEAARYAVLDGGKRLRAFMVCAGADLMNVPSTCALRVAAAVEMVHGYSLVHDDLPAMDDDDMRRGRPTVHRRFDEATAILCGDALLTLAFEVLADRATHADAAIRSRLVVALARAAGAAGMVGGQMIDLAASGLDLDVAGLERLQALKTGRLMAFSCKAGAILAADEQAERALGAYGDSLGLAFQVTDDILDVVGTAAETGKATGKDQAAGKATFVSRMGLDGARAHARALCDSAIAALAPFGGRVELLRQAAEFVVGRRS
jgi:farnesyl diphosphate synthase